MKCPICRSNNYQLIWNDKIRAGKNIWSTKKHKIYRCYNCSVGYLEKIHDRLEDNFIFRKVFDGSNSINKYLTFNKPRELKKLLKIKRFVSFKNKSILESNCGAASILDFLKKEAKFTAGLDNSIYKPHVEKKHVFFSSINQLNKSKIKFDIILSLAEIEHKKNPIFFVKSLLKNLKKNGIIIFRIPNYDNIYKYLGGNNFLKYDFRLSHNFYFDEKSADYMFKKLKLKVISKSGLQEYNANHLITFLKNFKRTKKINKIFTEKTLNILEKNIENNFVATSMLYIVRM